MARAFLHIGGTDYELVEDFKAKDQDRFQSEEARALRLPASDGPLQHFEVKRDGDKMTMHVTPGRATTVGLRLEEPGSTAALRHGETPPVTGEDRRGLELEP